MSCTPDCRKPKGVRQCHCSVCHLTFSGIRNFDLHRRFGKCAPPSTLNMTVKDDVWGFHGTYAADRQHWSTV